MSHTVDWRYILASTFIYKHMAAKEFAGKLTCVDFASEAEDSLADTCSDNGAVLFFVVDDLPLAAFDEVS